MRRTVTRELVFAAAVITAALPGLAVDSRSGLAGVPVPSRNIVIIVLPSFPVARPSAPVSTAVIVKNYGRRFDGVIEAWAGPREEADVAARRIGIGKGSFKFFLYPPLSDPYTGRLRVVVKDMNGKTCASQSVPVRTGGGQWWVGSVIGMGRRFSRENLPGVRVAVTTMRRVDLLPDSWRGYKAFDVIFWDGRVTGELEPAQRQALLKWVRTGGRLVLMAASGDQDLASPLPNIVPSLELETVETRAHTFPGGGERRRSYPSRKRKTLFKAEEFPTDDGMLWNEKAHGMGAVVWLRVPFSEMTALRREETAALLGRPGTDTGIKGMRPGDNVLQGLLARSAGYTQMSFTPVLITMLIYLAMVSVVDYLALRKLRRLPWTWVTFPCMIGIFSAFSFFAFYQGKLGNHERHELLVQDIGMDGFGRTLTMSCVRATSANPIEFEVDSSHMVRRLDLMGRAYNPWGGMSRRRLGMQDEGRVMALKTPGPLTRITIPAHVGSFRFFSEEWPSHTEELPFQCAVRIDRRNRLKGQIVKKTPMNVLQCFIFHRDRLYQLDRALRIPASVGAKVGGQHHEQYYYRLRGRVLRDVENNLSAALSGWVRSGIGRAMPPMNRWEMEADAAGRSWVADGAYGPWQRTDVAALFVFCEERARYAGMPVRRVRCIRQVIGVEREGSLQ